MAMWNLNNQICLQKMDDIRFFCQNPSIMKTTILSLFFKYFKNEQMRDW